MTPLLCALILLPCRDDRSDPAVAALEPVFQGLELKVHGDGQDDLVPVDVRCHRFPALDLFQRLAAECGRELVVDEAIEPLRLHAPLEARLETRPLATAVDLLAGAAGLRGRLRPQRIELHADDTAAMPTEVLLRRALAATTDALLGAPDDAEAPRLRFEIANILLALGDDAAAVREYETVLAGEASFGQRPLALLRLGHARRRLADSPGAIESWMQIIENHPRHALVPTAYLDCARVFLEDEDPQNASRAVRRVVETWTGPLKLSSIDEAARLLARLGEHERAARAWKRVLDFSSDPALRHEARNGRVRSFAARQQHAEIVREVRDALREQRDGRHAAELHLHLARAQDAAGEPGLAVLALEQAHDLPCAPAIRAELDLEEGRLWMRCSLWRRALPALARAAESSLPATAAEARRLHAECAFRHGHYETARESYRSLEHDFPEHHELALLGQAEVAVAQRDRRGARELIELALPRTEDPARRLRLLRLAEELGVRGLLDTASPSSSLPTEESR